MFGMGFFEILMIAVVAIIFLGPEKLPKALVDVAKFFRAVKKTMDEAKESLDREVNLSKIKEEALAYKNSITQEVQTLSKDLELKELNLDLEDNPLSSQESTNQSNPSQTAKTSLTQDSTISIDSTSQNPSDSSHLPKKEITPDKLNKTPLTFGSNLTQPKDQEIKDIKSQTARNDYA